jgi:drug/metabolite transporter (DMT)-like permease
LERRRLTDGAAFGFALAVIGSIPFAAYILPRKLSTLRVLNYQFWISVAIAPVGIAFAFIFGTGMNAAAPGVLASLVCGPIWAAGSICYSKAVDHIGVARSTPVKNFAPMFAAIYGIAIFHEYTIADPPSLGMTLAGVALMMLAAIVLGRAGAPERESAHAFDATRTAEERSAAMRAGWLYSFGSAFFFGLYAWPLKSALKSGMNPATSCAWLAIGVFAASSALIVWQSIARPHVENFLPNRRNLFLALLAGTIWITGQTIGTFAMTHVPMSISWPVTNLSTLIAMAWGVWIFKEVQIERHKREVAAAFVLYAAGIALLALAAPKGHV